MTLEQIEELLDKDLMECREGEEGGGGAAGEGVGGGARGKAKKSKAKKLEVIIRKFVCA